MIAAIACCLLSPGTAQPLPPQLDNADADMDEVMQIFLETSRGGHREIEGVIDEGELLHQVFQDRAPHLDYLAGGGPPTQSEQARGAATNLHFHHGIHCLFTARTRQPQKTRGRVKRKGDESTGHLPHRYMKGRDDGHCLVGHHGSRTRGKDTDDLLNEPWEARRGTTWSPPIKKPAMRRRRTHRHLLRAVQMVHSAPLREGEEKCLAMLTRAE